jgi:hypothetical protein
MIDKKNSIKYFFWGFKAFKSCCRLFTSDHPPLVEWVPRGLLSVQLPPGAPWPMHTGFRLILANQRARFPHQNDQFHLNLCNISKQPQF